MLAVDKLRALFQRAGMSAAESNAAVLNTPRQALGDFTDLDTYGPPHRMLGAAFVWTYSPEGHAYWMRVHARLHAYWMRGAAQ